MLRGTVCVMVVCNDEVKKLKNKLQQNVGIQIL
jgi:hypothetical protein